MKIKILEQFIEGKAEEQFKCEDLIFTGKRFFAVIDGATSKNDFLVEGKTTGRMAAELIKVALLKLDNIAIPLNTETILNRIHDEFDDVYKRDFKGVGNHIKMIASAVIYDSKMDNIYIVGDPKVMLLENNKWTDYSQSHKINIKTAEKRAKKIKRLIDEGVSVESLISNDLGRMHITGDLLSQSKHQNNSRSPLCYYTFDGTRFDKDKIRVIDSKNATEIILASDGYLKLYPTLIDSENHLKKILKEDPLLYKEYKETKGFYKGMNSFDDRAYLKLEKI